MLFFPGAGGGGEGGRVLSSCALLLPCLLFDRSNKKHAVNWGLRNNYLIAY